MESIYTPATIKEIISFDHLDCPEFYFNGNVAYATTRYVYDDDFGKPLLGFNHWFVEDENAKEKIELLPSWNKQL